MRAKEFLKEEFYDSFINTIYNQKHMVEIYKNPTRKELAELSEPEEGAIIRAYLTNDSLYAWKPSTGLHGSIRDHMGLDKNKALGIYLFYNPAYHNDIDIQITDSTKGTKWHHNPNVAEWIRLRPVWWINPKNITISYYDEAIVGKWEDLVDLRNFDNE